MLNLIIGFVSSIIAGVISYYICKLLDVHISNEHKD